MADFRAGDFGKKVFGKNKIIYEGKEINFKTPWQRIEYRDLIKNYTKLDIDYLNQDALAKEAKKLGLIVEVAWNKAKIIDEIYKKKVSEQKIEAKSIYQSKVETILNKMADREYKMKNGSDYFTHYWDYKKLENDLLAAIQEMEKFDDKQLPPSLKSKIEAKKISIEKNQELEKRKNAPPKGTFNPENLDR